MYQLEAEEILSLRFECSLYCGLPAFPPKWHTLTPDKGNLKVQQKKPWDTHTQIIDQPQSQPMTLTFSPPTEKCPAGEKKKKLQSWN